MGTNWIAFSWFHFVDPARIGFLVDSGSDGTWDPQTAWIAGLYLVHDSWDTVPWLRDDHFVGS